MLNDLSIGQRAKIIKVDANKDIKRRLLDMGFVKGTIVEKVLVSSSMVAYYIKGTVIALRKSDTKNIMVEECNENWFSW